MVIYIFWPSWELEWNFSPLSPWLKRLLLQRDVLSELLKNSSLRENIGVKYVTSQFLLFRKGSSILVAAGYVPEMYIYGREGPPSKLPILCFSDSGFQTWLFLTKISRLLFYRSYIGWRSEATAAFGYWGAVSSPQLCAMLQNGYHPMAFGKFGDGSDVQKNITRVSRIIWCGY